MVLAIGIMIVAGIFGGVVNLALNETSRRDWYWTILAGIGAALLIPLFLKTVSSQLLLNILKAAPEEPASPTLCDDCLVFFGFCLLAALSSRAFIQGLGQKILSNLEKGQETLKVRQNELEGRVNQTDQLAKETATKSDETALIAETAATGGVGLRTIRAQVDGRVVRTAIQKGSVPDDPWKGAFGGKSEANGRRLEATITPMASKEGWCSLTLRVFIC